LVLALLEDVREPESRKIRCNDAITVSETSNQMPVLRGHAKTGPRWSGQNQPTELKQVASCGNAGRALFTCEPSNACQKIIGSAHTEKFRLMDNLVETHQFPFIADERRVHSTLLERLAGIVDVRVIEKL
jgi:hypothetical protein